MPLTDIKCKSLEPRDKIYKVSDEKSLYLEVMPSGSKYWRFKYRFAGKENRLAFGVYPEVSLKEAREKRDKARKQIADGISPSQAKKLEKLQININHQNNFESIAREWHTKQTERWTERHSHYVLRRLEADIFTELGSRPIVEITPPELLYTLQKIEKRGAIDIAKRALQTCGQIFRFGISTGRANRDISSDLKGALTTRKKTNYSRLKENELPEFFQKLAKYDGEPQTKLALNFLILTFVRTKELRGARWEEFNFEAKEWHIPSERMKMRQKHIVPLSKQTFAIIEEIRKINGNKQFLFPSQINPNKTISENTVLYAIYRMGYHSRTTAHGFRGTASTILNEKGFDKDHIERQLAHGDNNSVRASYNHADYLPQRHNMMQWWADYLDKVAGKS
jgi:integrase